MSVIIESIQTYDNINGSSDKTPYMAANTNSIQFVEVQIRFETYLLTKSTSETTLPDYFIQVNPLSRYTGKVQDNRAIYTNKLEGWGEDYKVGDTFTISGTASNNVSGTIIEIYEDGQTLITDQTFTLETFPLGAYVAITTPQTSIEYLFNLIENEEPINYNSKVDGDEQRASISQLVYTDTVTERIATLLGNRSWQFGSITVKGNGTGNGDSSLVSGAIQSFLITHEVIISPLMLFDEWDDIQQGIKPDRFLDGNALKYVFSTSLSQQANNPNDLTTVEEFELLGNTGWFNENLNGKPNNYSFSDLVYKRLDNTINPSLELTTNQTKIEFSVINATDNPFSIGNSKLIFGINFAPSDPSQYRDIPAATTQTMDYNYIFDQVVETLEDGTQVPRQFGTDLQVILDVQSTLVSSSKIDVVANIQMASDVVSRIGANSVQQYMIYVEVADHTLDRSETDKVQLLLDANNYYTDFSDDGMIVMSQTFLTHPYSDIETETNDFPNSFIESDILGINNFYIDKNGRESDEIKLTGITSQIIARKNTGASFVLDSSFRSLSAFPSIEYATYGSITNANFVEPRGFKTPVDDNRANFRLLRNYDSDSAGLFYFRSQFPTYIGWDSYTAVTGVNDEFFDPNEPNDGFNNNWIRYDAASAWSIYYRTIVNATKNGNPFSYESISQIITHDYTAGDEWDTEQIRSFDENDVDITGFGIKYADGKVQANFTYIGAAPNPSISDIVIDFHIYVFQEGTLKSVYTLSSAYDAHPNTYFKSIDNSNRTVVTNPVSNVFRGEALIQGSLLPNKNKFQVSAILYDKRAAVPPPPPAVPKLMEDGTAKIMDGATFKIME